MILFFHLFWGALIIAKIPFLPLAVFLEFFSHCFFDFLPHNEYLIENLKKKKWKNSFLDSLKLSGDIIMGLILIYFVSRITKINYFFLVFGGFLAALPDVFLGINCWFPGNPFLERTALFHKREIHFFKYKKIPQWGKTLTQILVIVIGFAILFF